MNHNIPLYHHHIALHHLRAARRIDRLISEAGSLTNPTSGILIHELIKRATQHRITSRRWRRHRNDWMLSWYLRRAKEAGLISTTTSKGGIRG